MDGEGVMRGGPHTAAPSMITLAGSTAVGLTDWLRSAWQWIIVLAVNRDHHWMASEAILYAYSPLVPPSQT